MRLLRSLAAMSAVLVVSACTSAGSAGSVGSASSGPSSPSAASAGSSGAPSVFPIVVNSELGVGDNRFLFVFVDRANNPAAKPDREVSVAFRAPGASDAGPAQKASFLWGIDNVRGYYLVPATFPSAGSWQAIFTTSAPGSPTETIPFGFDVKQKTTAKGVGDQAPSVRTPTLADVGGDVGKIASDPHPDLGFYKVSEDAALASKQPFVLAFMTPAFCTSALCGPQLDKVKASAKAYPTVTFINVEPYKLQYTGGRLQPLLDAQGQLQAVGAVNAFGIQSEPWLYVVDRTGVIRASLEGVFSDQELKAALDAVK
jgi:hypothetical protein